MMTDEEFKSKIDRIDELMRKIAIAQAIIENELDRLWIDLSKMKEFEKRYKNDFQ